MALFNSINIQNNFASVLTIDKKDGFFTVIKDEVLELSELKDYLIDKKNFYVSSTQDNILDEEVTIASAIKNDKVIKNLILSKLKNLLFSNNILLNYTKLSKNKQDETTTYKVVGVYEEEYLKMFQYFNDTSEIKNATISRYSLFSISQKCIKADNYLSVYTHANKIMILAVQDNKLVGYVRASSIVVDDPMERHNAMINEINKTIAYIGQQYRDVKFSLIALSGSISIDNVVCEQISLIVNIPICVLYPNTKFKGLSNEEFQHYILPLGNYFVNKKFNFIPTFIISARQYLIGVRASLIFSILVFFTTLYFAYDAYSQYKDILVKYEGNKNNLLSMIQRTSTYSQVDLQKSWTHIEIAEKYLKDYPSDTFLLLRPLIELRKPESIDWKNENDNSTFKITFKKQFSSLESLYRFEKKFNELFNDINSSISAENINKTDYTTLEFNAIISTLKMSNTDIQNSKRKRKL
ncbi:hypothetical protein [Candidatus Sulfurimonas baltica]|uniref:Uncharacterized protein n=1 Tax=Candidatus Sulfurimonas baltica TaxID=2740404 RepID=A0A7S7LX31_9BACT|nr:hypothetical protein [Candidatus Sulfurimonas baltica]QOY53063.1 hypothetical protein HUE88_05125 [Candidatus Sulfurimonas baltica]